MDLTSAASDFSQSTLMTKIQYAVARKLLDSQQSEGAAMVNLIQQAGDTQSHASDALVAAASGLGGSLDVTA